MIKNYESKKRKYESIKKYNTYETVMTSIDSLKQVIINEYMNAGANVNIENLITVINDKYGVEYDVIQLKPPQLDASTSANLFGAIEGQYEEILNKIQADKKIYYDDEFSCMKAVPVPLIR
ncbi:hypothetical protein RF11_00772 [Thelohanellus kitauei]|uniref:Uncharacterized protein n=1 Tax=Thelohanellus kitauei TaxID=669202 RepID=A0A0C2NBL6_THEKT|nr:hypothetical protein RF11_00772 [Thelohanellus kitauei]